jgi:hypothetical protein
MIAATEPVPYMATFTKRLIHELGTLLVPAGAVGLFCQVMGIDAQRTAAYSIASILFVTCCLHRGWINTKIPSALVLAVTVGLGTIFFFNFQNLLLKDTGLIKRFRESSDFQAEVGSQIAASNDEIWFFGTNFHISAVDRRPLLLKRLMAGVKVRYLVVDPFVPNMAQIAKDFDQSRDELADECTKGLKEILELRQQWTKNKGLGELDVRFFDTTPRARLYVFDPNRPSGRSMFVPYINRVNSPALPGYLLENSPTGVFGSYFSGIRTLWNEATKLDEFLAHHPEFRS